MACKSNLCWKWKIQMLNIIRVLIPHVNQILLTGFVIILRSLRLWDKLSWFIEPLKWRMFRSRIPTCYKISSKIFYISCPHLLKDLLPFYGTYIFAYVSTHSTGAIMYTCWNNECPRISNICQVCLVKVALILAFFAE